MLTTTWIAETFSTIFACAPVTYAWDMVIGAQGSCINRPAAVYAYAALNITYDFIVLLLPIPRLLRLKVSTGEKIGYAAPESRQQRPPLTFFQHLRLLPCRLRSNSLLNSTSNGSSGSAEHPKRHLELCGRWLVVFGRGVLQYDLLLYACDGWIGEALLEIFEKQAFHICEQV